MTMNLLPIIQYITFPAMPYFCPQRFIHEMGLIFINLQLSIYTCTIVLSSNRVVMEHPTFRNVFSSSKTNQKMVFVVVVVKYGVISKCSYGPTTIRSTLVGLLSFLKEMFSHCSRYIIASRHSLCLLCKPCLYEYQRITLNLPKTIRERTPLNDP